MTTNRRDGMDTRGRLLDAAGLVFATKGFHDTKTAEICRTAKANVAAVNYYFGGKEKLYVKSRRHEFERSIAMYPPDGGMPAEAPAEDRLRGHIRALVGRFMDPISRDLDIAHREMSNPTGLLAEVMHKSIEPLRRMHLGIVRELLGPRVTEQEVQLCEMSIHAQCFVALMHERQRRLVPQGARQPTPPRLNIDGPTLAEHIVRFSLAGLREVKSTAGRPRRITGNQSLEA